MGQSKADQSTNHIFPETLVCSVGTLTLDELPVVLEAQV